MPQVRTHDSCSATGPKRMGDISTYLGRGMPSATSMIDRLVSKGLVERMADASDRRVVACRLTALGEEARGEVLAARPHEASHRWPAC